MFRRPKLVMTLAMLLTWVLVLSACGSKGTTTPTSGSGSSGALAPIKIGLVGIMTGANAENGEYTSSGAKLAVAEINSAGGVQLPGESSKRNLDLVIEDDQATPDVGINAIKKLVDSHKVTAFLGPDFSGITYAALFVGEESGTPQITSSISSKITKEGKKFIFRGRSGDEVWMTSLIDYLVTDLGYKKIAFSYTNNELGKNGVDVGIKYLKEKYNLTPVVTVSHAAGDKDLSTSASKVAEAKPDVLVNWGLQIEASLLIRDLRNLGWQGVFAFQAADDIFVKLAQKNAVGVLGPQNWVYTKKDPASQKFAQDFKAKFGKNPSPHSVIYYDGVKLLSEAFTKVGTDRQKVRDYLAGVKDYQGVEGHYRSAELKGGEMSTATVIIKYNQDLVPEVVKSFE